MVAGFGVAGRAVTVGEGRSVGVCGGSKGCLGCAGSSGEELRG